MKATSGQTALTGRSSGEETRRAGAGSGPPDVLSCGVCARVFRSERGRSQHARLTHPTVFHDRNQPVRRSRARWSEEEVAILAREEARLRSSGVEPKRLSELLKPLLPNRTLEAIKGRRKNAAYKAAVQAMIELEAEPAQDEEYPAPDEQLPDWREPIMEHLRTLRRGSSDWCENLLDEAMESLEDGHRDQAKVKLELFSDKFWEKGHSKEGESSDRRSAGRRLHFIRPSNTGRRELRRWEYRTIQSMYREDPGRTIRNILEGNPTAQPNMPKDLGTYWKKVFETEPNSQFDPKIFDSVRNSSPQGSQASIKHDALIKPITVEEVSATLKKSKAKASGPDGITLGNLNKVPFRILVKMFNLFLLLGETPRRFSLKRTVLIPKQHAKRMKASMYRPITLTSMVTRVMNKILARRLTDEIPFGPSQKAFLPVDGCAEALLLLEEVLKKGRECLRETHVAFLDLTKAFDSVPHALLWSRARSLGVPEGLITYLRSGYTDASTTVRGRKVVLRRGVLQGDPVSPWLFNSLISHVVNVCKVQPVGPTVNGVKVPILAYADDLVLLASSRVGLQSQLDLVSKTLQDLGLSLNISKSRSLGILVDGNRKRWTGDMSARYTLSGIPGFLPSIRIGQVFKYLGVEIGQKGKESSPGCKMQVSIERLSSAPLKPQQKLNALVSRVIPGLLHTLVLGSSYASTLKRLDKASRSAVRQWLHLPKDTPTSFIHTPLRFGGLGVQRLAVLIPDLKQARMKNLLGSDDPAVESVVSTRMTTISSENPPTRMDRALNEAAVLYETLDGKGLKEGHKLSKWVSFPGCQAMSGSDFVEAVKVRGGLYETKTRNSRGVSSGNRQGPATALCSAGCNSVESMGHIVNGCMRTHRVRVKRHDAIVGRVTKALKKAGYKTQIEPRISTSEGLRKPDVVCSGKGKTAFLDVQIVADSRNLNEANADKISKYSRLPELTTWARDWANLSPNEDVIFGAITFNWRASMSLDSLKTYYDLGLPKYVLEHAAMSVLRDTAVSMRMFKQCTALGGRPRCRFPP